MMGEMVYDSHGDEHIDDPSGVAFVTGPVYTAMKGVPGRFHLASPVESPEADHARDLAENHNIAEARIRDEQEESRRSSIASVARSLLAVGSSSRHDQLTEQSIAIQRALYGDAQRFHYGSVSPSITGSRNTPVSQRSGYQGATLPPYWGHSTPPDA